MKGKGFSASLRGNTYLNLCAVLSSQGKCVSTLGLRGRGLPAHLLRVVRRHQGALDAAKQALAWLRKGLSAVPREQDGEEEQPESRYLPAYPEIAVAGTRA